MRGLRSLIVAGSAVLLLSCTTLRYPALGSLYDRTAQHHAPDRNPIVVIPGILGTRLETPGGEVVWGAFAGRYARPGRPRGARLLALPLQPGEARPDVRPTEVLDRLRVRILGLPLELKAYLHILAALGAGGYRDETLGRLREIDYGDDHFTCFQFPYDWRLSNAENAARLHRFLLEKRGEVRRELERRYGLADAPVRFDLIAHSMGGLLARYYLRYGPQPLPTAGPIPSPSWAGARLVERAILVAPPNGGSLLALDRLLRGERFAFFLPRYRPAILGTFPSLYEMLPRARHGAYIGAASGERLGDALSPALWEELGWGLADPREDAVLEMLLPGIRDPAERRRLALATLSRNLRGAERFHAALDRPAAPPAGTEIYLVAGDSRPTPASVRIDRRRGRVEVVERRPGDGRVLRSSALMDERLTGDWGPSLVSPVRWSEVLFVFAGHLGLTKHRSLTDNLLYRLLEEPRSAGEGLRVGERGASAFQGKGRGEGPARAAKPVGRTE